MADINRIIQVLKENKVDDKAASQFIADLNNMIAQQVEMEIVSTLGEADFKNLNELGEAQAHTEISQRYKAATGVSIQQKSDELLDGFVSGFLTEYQREKLKEKEQ